MSPAGFDFALSSGALSVINLMTLNQMRAAWLAVLLLFLATPELWATPVLNSLTADAVNVGRYEKMELSIGLTAAFTNPYDPKEID